MFKFKAFAAFAAISPIVGFSAPAYAGAAISAWVSGAGQDISSCGPMASPCRTFQYAHDNVLGPNGGDILVRDSGSFGPLAISKPVSVINDGVGTAGTGAPSGQVAISINTSGNVLLKGLTIEGNGEAYGGINARAAANLTIANCLVQNFTQYGISVDTFSGTLKFLIADTIVQNNSVYGVYVYTYAGTVQGNINNAKILNNGAGVEASGRTTQFAISDTVISGNATGVYLSGYSTQVLLRRSTITWNTSGYYTTQALLQSYQDNSIINNGSNSGTLQPISSN